MSVGSVSLKKKFIAIFHSSCIPSPDLSTGAGNLSSTGQPPTSLWFFFSSRRRHTRSVSAFLLNRSSDLSVDRFVIVSIFIPKLRLILILNSFLGSSDSLVFSELFHSLAPRPLAARSISDFLLTYLAT